jgi:hypothetical protein
VIGTSVSIQNARPPQAAGHSRFAGLGNDGKPIKFEPIGISPVQMVAKGAKGTNAPRYRSFSAEIELWFELSSLGHPAYRVPFGHAGVRGPALVNGFDPAETT